MVKKFEQVKKILDMFKKKIEQGENIFELADEICIPKSISTTFSVFSPTYLGLKFFDI